MLETCPDAMRSPTVSGSEAGVSLVVSTTPMQEVPYFSTALHSPALRGFVDGFVGSLVGGLVYCMILAYFNYQDLQIAGLRVLALSLTFGGFEMWRVRRQRTAESFKKCVLLTLSASMVLFWALGASFSGTPTRDSLQEARPQLQQVRLDPIA
ncbi:MAG: hypothetical protein IH602_10045 [Bryobacteraceae bacterium]|nr:hypothetical protein [Bryobacteraceae bacterium]